MAQELINVGSQDYAGDGESLRNALIKVNNNFTEVYASLTEIAFSGSYNDLTDKPLLFDGDYNSLSNLPSIPTAVSDLTNDSGFITSADIAGGTLTIDVNNTGDLQGSVFADDSTLLVDGVNGSIPYSVISDVQVTESDLSVDFAAIVGTQIQTNGLPVNTFTTGDLEVRGTLNAEDGSDFELSSTNDVNINTSVGDENHTFEFKNDGTFYMAKNAIGNNSYISTPRNDANAYLTLVSALDVIVQANDSTGSLETWTFKTNGALEYPDATEQITAWTGSVDWTNVTNTPTIPTLTSQLTNDSGFITTAALTGYATETFVTNQGYLTAVPTSLTVSSLTNNIGDIDISATDVTIQTVDDIELFAGDDLVIYTNYGSGTDKLFVFRGEGDIEFPDGTFQDTAWTGTYTPTTSSDWNTPAPTTIAEAIDRLAALVKTLNSGTGA